MDRKRQILTVIILLTVLWGCGGGKHQHQTGNTNHDCSYCGMPSQEFPQWNAKMTSKKGEQWFCSPRCMFLTVLDKENTPSGIQSIQVTDYYESEKIDAQQAFYVIKSDVIGPMGQDLVPFSDKNAAQDFQKEHEGEILSFLDVNLKIIQNIVNGQ